ncbi:MAG: RNA 2',3'-cyclic phosphodiesterase [Phycisphaerales bacterium]|nr:RNA 2',3'-cyclic phosphodiesterase [Phycisphaerales bacterium]
MSTACLDTMRRIDLPHHRETAVAAVHLTLHFIGDTDPKCLEEITESVARSASGIGVFTLTPERLVTLPRAAARRSEARVVAMETDAPAGLLELVRRLVGRLAVSPRKDPTDRYRPHLTLCRFRGPVRGLTLEQRVDLEPFDVSAIHLMRSVLKPGGAEHTEIARFDLR